MRIGEIVGEIVHIAEVVKGDLVSETASPEGPWYEVLSNGPGLLVLDGRNPGDPEPLPVRIATSLTSGVMRQPR